MIHDFGTLELSYEGCYIKVLKNDRIPPPAPIKLFTNYKPTL